MTPADAPAYTIGRSGIRAVADAAGVSVSTVSRALNGYTDVKSETRTRIEAAAEELGYRPSYAAAMLRRNLTSTVTFMVSKPWTKFVDPYFLAIGQTLRTGHSLLDRDQRRIGLRAAGRMTALGHRRIAFLSTPPRYTYSHHTRDGYRRGLEDAGLVPDPTPEIECFLSRRTGEEAVMQLFASGAAPTALFCGNDMIALSAMEGLKRLGLAPGRDVALIGCDDMPLAAHLRPALTSFSQDLDAMGSRLGRMVLARLGGDRTVQQEFVKGRLTIRESDSPLPQAARPRCPVDRRTPADGPACPAEVPDGPVLRADRAGERSGRAEGAGQC